MSLWRHVTRGFSSLFNRTAADRDVTEELEHYLQQTKVELMAKGMSPEDADRAARIDCGNRLMVREEVRSSGWENSLQTLFSDLRYAIRRLRQKPGFAAVSILTLALGIGATAAIFSVINGVLLKPLPYPNAERLVALGHTAPGINLKDLNMSASLYYTYSDESRVFEDVAMWREDTYSVTGLAEPEEVRALETTVRFLNLLRIQPALGRAFSAADEDPKGERNVLLSDGYWRTRFGGDTAVLGRRIMMDGNAYEVIGVLPPSFHFMDKNVSLLVPLRFNRANVKVLNFNYQGIAELKPGITLDQANRDVNRMIPMAPTKFQMNAGFSLKMFEDARITSKLRFLKEELIGDISNTLWLLMATMGIVLLIACANVANLLLVRADGRQQELAVRAALGAGWMRIARELLLESLTLSVLGGALGLALAYAAVRVLTASDATHLPRLHDISIDPRVILFALCLSVGCGLLFGLIPVFKYARPQLSNALRGAGRTLSESRERHRARGILVVLQVALALILLVSSGLMIRTFQSLRRVDPGFFNAHTVQSFRIGIPGVQVKEPDRVIQMEQEIQNRVAAIPGVTTVAMVSRLPFEAGGNDPIYAQDRSYKEGTIPPVRRYKFVSPGYFAAIGTRLIAGRDLTWAETYNKIPVAVLSETLARELWEDPRVAVGKRIRPNPKDDWFEVIGVAADLRDDGVDQKAPAIVYWPLLAKNFESDAINVERTVAYVIRTPRAGSASILPELRQAVASVNPNLPLADMKTLEELYDRSLARTSFTLVLLAAAGGMALLLGVVGIYGVISYSVSQRTREIGIRIALGAPLQGVTAMFVRHGLLLSGAGAAFGLTAAFALTRLMKSVLFDVSPADPLTYVAASAGLILAAMLASYLPARKATSVDPVQALRAE